MKVLYAKCFGLGNAVMAVPAIKALASVHGPIDVLIGSLSDDMGALDVMSELKWSHRCIDSIYVNFAPIDQVYDAAILAIPFDGRWREGVHFRAKRVLDGRPRPGDPNVLGIKQWEKHEVEYQLENAIEMGYTGKLDAASLPCSFLTNQYEVDPDLVYLGIGFKRDAKSFWSKKHWGNDRFSAFIGEVARLRPQTKFVATGGNVDVPVMRELEKSAGLKWVFNNIRGAFQFVQRAGSYFGNDTGMAHVAASLGIPTYVMTAFEGSEVKNPPWCVRAKCNSFHTTAMDPESVAADFIDFVWGEHADR